MALWRTVRNTLFPHRPHAERRAVDRILLPLCPTCHSRENVRSRSRSDYAVYFECSRCGEQIALSKPKGGGRVY